MRFKTIILLVIAVIFICSAIVSANDTEKELTNKFLQRLESKHAQKLTWISGYFSVNRINRDNDYNKFANFESNNFSTADFSWLGDAKSFGLEMGVIFKEKYAWSIGGEYTMKLGEELSGSYLYNPTGTLIENPSSQISLYGFQTGLQYYIYNAPTLEKKLTSLAIRTGISVGYYQVKWDLWSDYSNLNLATSAPTGTNTTFQDNAPSFEIHLGADYPTNFLGLDLGLDMSYLYLNFNQVAWYNSQDNEVVASYNGTSEGRVDLNLSGIRGKIELKHFFNW